MGSVPERADLRAPDEVKWIARKLEAAGFEAWAVGGGVRDALVGRRPEDWDIATSAHPQDVRRVFRRTVPIGIEHGTVGVVARDGRMYEVTTFRRDVETFGRKARVAFAESLEEDLERRDFTINAVAWNPSTREVRDPHGGMRDLRSGLLRTVGDPDERFAEDRLRVLRALRFAGRFELRIEGRTWVAIQRSSDKLDHLSAERIREELWKVISGQRRASVSLELYATSGVLRSLYPELERCRGIEVDFGAGAETLWNYLIRVVDAVSPAHPRVRFAGLLHRVALGTFGGSANPATVAGASAALARELLRRIRGSNADVDTVSHLVAQHVPPPPNGLTDSAIRQWLRRVGREHVNDLFRLLFSVCQSAPRPFDEEIDVLHLYRRSRHNLRQRVPLSVSDLAIGGDDLRRLGIPPGPLYGEILRDLLDRVTEEPTLNDPAKLTRLVVHALGGRESEKGG